MQTAVQMNPEDVIEQTSVAENEEEATFHLQTIIIAKDNPITGEQLQAIVEESKRTGQTFAHLARNHLPNADSIKTVVAPAESIPDIARRTERGRR